MRLEKTAKTTIAGILWTVVGALGVSGTVWNEAEMRFWALTIALVACMVTCHLLFECTVHRERIRVEDLVQALIAEAKARASEDVSPLRR